MLMLRTQSNRSTVKYFTYTRTHFSVLNAAHFASQNRILFRPTSFWISYFKRIICIAHARAVRIILLSVLTKK